MLRGLHRRSDTEGGRRQARLRGSHQGAGEFGDGYRPIGGRKSGAVFGGAGGSFFPGCFHFLGDWEADEGTVSFIFSERDVLVAINVVTPFTPGPSNCLFSERVYTSFFEVLEAFVAGLLFTILHIAFRGSMAELGPSSVANSSALVDPV